MNKPFLLIAGAGYYPCGGTGDWIGCFSTKEEALEQLKEDEFSRFGKYTITDKDGITQEHDWYKIVDLREWTE